MAPCGHGLDVHSDRRYSVVVVWSSLRQDPFEVMSKPRIKPFSHRTHVAPLGSAEAILRVSRPRYRHLETPALPGGFAVRPQSASNEAPGGRAVKPYGAAATQPRLPPGTQAAGAASHITPARLVMASHAHRVSGDHKHVAYRCSPGVSGAELETGGSLGSLGSFLSTADTTPTVRMMAATTMRSGMARGMVMA